MHEINGIKYIEYILGSQDFRDRVANNKFATMPMFGKAPRGFIALQGDHGEIAFRNIKLRKIKKPLARSVRSELTIPGRIPPAGGVLLAEPGELFRLCRSV